MRAFDYEQDDTDDADASLITGEPDAGGAAAVEGDDDDPAAVTDGAAVEAPLWRTADGDLLHLTPDVLDSFVVWLRQRRHRRGGRRRGRRHLKVPSVAERRRAIGGMGRFARRARRIGTLRHRPSGRRYPVFRARAGRTRMRVIARPRGGRRFEILGIGPEIGGLGAGFSTAELEVLATTESGAWQTGSARKRLRVRGAQAHIVWTGPLSLQDAAKDGRAGVYIVYRDNRPIYVGETDRFGRRWRQRLDVLLNLGIDPSPWTVWVGEITQKDARKVAAVLLRQDVEHVLVRVLRRFQLKNRKPRNKLIANAAGIHIENSGKIPPYLRPTITVKGGAELEITAPAVIHAW